MTYNYSIILVHKYLSCNNVMVPRLLDVANVNTLTVHLDAFSSTEPTHIRLDGSQMLIVDLVTIVYSPWLRVLFPLALGSLSVNVNSSIFHLFQGNRSWLIWTQQIYKVTDSRFCTLEIVVYQRLLQILRSQAFS